MHSPIMQVPEKFNFHKRVMSSARPSVEKQLGRVGKQTRIRDRIDTTLRKRRIKTDLSHGDRSSQPNLVADKSSTDLVRPADGVRESAFARPALDWIHFISWKMMLPGFRILDYIFALFIPVSVERRPILRAIIFFPPLAILLLLTGWLACKTTPPQPKSPTSYPLPHTRRITTWKVIQGHQSSILHMVR